LKTEVEGSIKTLVHT